MSLSQHKQVNQETECAELQSHITGLFGSHLKSLSVGISAEGIILRGTCDSFYIKQSVQEIVRKHSSLRIFANDLVVQDREPSQNNVPLEVNVPGLQDANQQDASQHESDNLESSVNTQRRFNTIFHPSDFSNSSNVAFVHALKLTDQIDS